MTLGVNDISRGVVALFGLSAAGKGEVYTALKAQIEKRGGVVVYAGSGAMYREAAKTNPELAAKMARGEQIDNLDDIFDGLATRWKEYIRLLSEGKTAIIVLDGMWRRPGFRVDDTDEIQISQSRQIAIALGKALGELKAEGTAFGPELVDLAQAGYEVGKITHGAERLVDLVLHRANTVYVDVTEGDAKALMWGRCALGWETLVNQLRPYAGNLGEDVFDLFETMVWALDGRTTRDSGGQIVKDESKESMRFRPRGKEEGETGSHIAWLKERIAPGDARVSGVVAELSRKLGVKLVAPRDDDLLLQGLDVRVGEFKTNTREGVLRQELGYEPDERGVLRSGDERRYTVLNGPSRGISLEELRKSAQGLAEDLWGRISSPEGNGRQRERR